MTDASTGDQAAGMTNPIQLIGSGGGSRAIAAVCSKRWFGTISAVPQTEGQLAAKYLIQAVRGKKISPAGSTSTS